MNKAVLLKVKIKSLTAEARIIRREASKIKVRELRRREAAIEGDTLPEELHGLRMELQGHRRFVLRPEARATLIAYGYLRGKTYRQIEPSARKKLDWSKVQGIVKRFGSPSFEEFANFEAWQKAATTPQEIANDES